MTTQVAISPEIARLAQRRTRPLGASLAAELARNIAQEAILDLDPELGLLVDEEAAYSHVDALVSAFAVNDIVVNGNRFDVRTVDEEGRIAVSRALVGTRYFQRGTLVVRLDSAISGSVVGFVSADNWQRLDNNATDQQMVFMKAAAGAEFDLGAKLQEITEQPAPALMSPPKPPEMFELATFIANRQELIVARQRQIVEGALARPETWTQLESVVSHWSKGLFRRVLTSAAVWNQRVEKITDKLASKFNRLKREDVKALVAKVGESFGGQAESADFRKALLAVATREELSHSLAGSLLQKAQTVAEGVLSGGAMTDAVKDVAKNKAAVEIAGIIKRGRRKISGFTAATAEELSGAYSQLALQPVYSTHSQDPQAGVEAINEALTILEAGEIAERIAELEAELAQI
jgi:hypothetical protein